MGVDRFVRVTHHPIRWLTAMLFDIEITGRQHLPPAGPYVVTANHLSLIDPILVTLAAGVQVRYLALDELFGKARILDVLMNYFGSIPISRVRPPLGAIKEGLAVLRSGSVLGVFPEGGRAKYWGERPIKPGAAWLAMATGSPLVPCSILGTEGLLSMTERGIRLPSVRLSLHPPLDPDSYLGRVDPLGAMMDDWKSALDGDLAHWQPGGVT
jgi:1-acyl-sn-glycerol-3-phosphate acyltransferase